MNDDLQIWYRLGWVHKTGMVCRSLHSNFHIILLRQPMARVVEYAAAGIVEHAAAGTVEHTMAGGMRQVEVLSR